MTHGAHHAADHFIRWLSRGFSGCQFASFLARENQKTQANDRILCTTFLEDLAAEDLPDIEHLIDDAAAREQIALFLFPRLRTPRDVAALALTLSQHERWTCSNVEWGAAKRDGCSLLSLNWTTQSGAPSSAIGFAPLGSMPVTRRAPYVAIALWSGGHQNEHKPSDRPEIGFVDFPISIDKAAHDELWNGTRTDVRELLSDPPEDAVLLRRVTFCLPDETACS